MPFAVVTMVFRGLKRNCFQPLNRYTKMHGQEVPGLGALPLVPRRAGEGSLSGAARTLGLTQPTVGRHIRELESSLGTKLFTRSQSGLGPTDAAHTVAPHARAMAGAAAALIRTVSAKDFGAHAVVRIAASEIVGTEVLPPILTEFRAKHPGIVMELSLSDRMEDLLRRDADVAVRMARPKQGSLVAKRVGAVTVGLHAHRRYLDEHGQPNNIQQLAQHALIGFDRETASIRALQRLGLKLTRDDFSFRTDSHLAQLAAIRAGFGIGICQTAIAQRDMDLIRLMPKDFAFDLEVWIAMHEDLRASRPMREIFDHLASALGGYARVKGGPRR
jgi:DNA-binding transcriptional LysR family regulator